MNIFDSIQKTAFEVVTASFGYDATWMPSNGDPEQKESVLYKDPTEAYGFVMANFHVERHVMEYQKGQFPGLKENVDNGNIEKINIDNGRGEILRFTVKYIESRYDGKTIRAHLNTLE